MEYIGEGQESIEATAEVIRGNVQLVYISPESLLENAHYRMMLLSRPYKEN